MRAILIALSMASAPAASTAAAVPVYVEQVLPDSAPSQALGYFLRDTIRKSSSLQLTDTPDGASLRISTQTMQPTNLYGAPLPQVIYSAIFFFRNPAGEWLYLDSMLGICGPNVSAQCSTDIVAALDGDLERIREAAKHSHDHR